MAVTVISALPLTPEQRARIEAFSVEVLEVPPQPEDSVLEDLVSRAEVWFGPRMRPNLFSKGNRLRWIQLISAGVDRYLFPEMVESEVILTNVRGMHAQTIADHVYAMILAFARELPHFQRRQAEKIWDRRQVSGLGGKTLSVIGLGGIGSEVARRAHAFGMKAIGTRRHPQPIDGVDEVLGGDGLEKVLEVGDWVVLACPLTKETHHLIGELELKTMKNESFLINIGRGKLIDENALVQALDEGWIAGAGLDVFEEEPLPESSPLWERDNVIVTPHVSGSIDDYMDRAIDIFCDNLRLYLGGDPLQNVVDKQLGY